MKKYKVVLEVEVICPEGSNPAQTISAEEVKTSLLRPPGSGYAVSAYGEWNDTKNKLTANMCPKRILSFEEIPTAVDLEVLNAELTRMYDERHYLAPRITQFERALADLRGKVWQV